MVADTLSAPQNGERQGARAEKQGGGGQNHGRSSKTTARGQRRGFRLHHCLLRHGGRHKDHHCHQGGRSQQNYPFHCIPPSTCTVFLHGLHRFPDTVSSLE